MPMLDAVLLVTGIAFFIVAIVYEYACNRI